MVLSMVSATMRIVRPSSSTGAGTTEMGEADSSIEYKSYLVIGTAYALHDEDEPTKGRILVLSCSPDGGPDGTASSSSRAVRTVTELQVRGGVYSMCQFYEGKLLVTVNSKTQVCQMVNDGTGVVKLSMVGVGHHGHILSLFVKSRAGKMLGTSQMPSSEALHGDIAADNDTKPAASESEQEMLAIVGDLMRSISLVQYYPQHETLEEVARDFNANWTTAVEMLTDDVFLGGENWNNLFVLRRNTKAQSEEIRCRLDTVGEFHLGEMCNKFMSGSLVMPHSTNSASNNPSSTTSRNRHRPLASPKKSSSSDNGKPAASPGGAGAAVRSRRPAVVIGSQTLFGTVDGTLGSILGLDGPTAAFFSTLERSMERVIIPVGNFSHQQFRAFNAEQRVHPSHGFVDGDLVEAFLDLDRSTMELVVQQMNRDGGWEIDDPAFTAAGNNNEKEGDGNADMADEERPELAVEDVLAVVEEMTMLH
jgi:DNA damage-binding protein 1